MQGAKFALTPNASHAQAIIRELLAVGFPAREINVVTTNDTYLEQFSPREASKAAEGFAFGGSAGAVLGGLVAVAAMGAPGLSLFAAGPIAAMIASSVAAMGISGGVTGALVAYGLSELEAQRHAKAIARGGILIAVSTPTSADAKVAQTAFDRHRAVRLEPTRRVVPRSV